MSETQPKTVSFLELYRDRQVSAQQIHDFIEEWHDSDDSERRSLAEFLGMTDEEYSVWLASRDALPAIVEARQTGRPLVDLVAEHLAELQRAARPEDRAAVYVLTHRLAKRTGS